MEQKQLEEQILEIVRQEKTIPEHLDLSAPLADAGIDSLDALNILFAIEEKFGIHIPDDRARAIRNLDDIVAAVREQIPQ
jgi:acyl carrier protein